MFDSRLELVTGAGEPPSAGTRKTGPPRLGEKRIVSEIPQLPPRPSWASQIIRIGPPSAGTAFSLPSAKKAISFPSGDQKGALLPLVPGISCTSCERKDCSQSEQVLLPTMDAADSTVEHPMKATRLPSGEICGGPFRPVVAGITPAGKRTETVQRGLGADRVA